MQAYQRREKVTAPPSHCASLLPTIAAAGYGGTFPQLARREGHRWAFKAPATICYQDANGRLISLEATVLDLSAAGVGLLTAEPIPQCAAAAVFVPIRRFEYSANVKVVHCTAGEDGYQIGCEFVVCEE